VICLSYNAGYLEPSAAGRELSNDAIWLAELVARAMPREAEGWGLLALLTFLSSRTLSRFDEQGRLVLLTDIGGLYSADPRHDPSARLVEEVREVESLEGFEIGVSTSPLGSGGMRSKVVAAEMATAAGIPVAPRAPARRRDHQIADFARFSA
jgi:hypothetical protein